MKTAPRSAGAFTLIEMIGVLAIMAIMAGVIVPRALHSIDTAAISAESQTLANLGGQIPLYLKDQGAAPTAANWTTALAAYAGLSPTNLSANSRHVNRVYLADPASNPSQRVMILSSMRASLRLPAAINGAAAFQTIWQTADGAVPDPSSWNGWSRWANVAQAGDFLVIERVNLLPVYETDLQSLTLTLNNRGAGTTSYNLVLADGTGQATVNVAPGGTVILSNQRPKVRLNLYRAAAGGGLDYSYVLSTTGKTFDFNGTDWIPQ
ncbi:MAG TPA: prepilin-type N-terminal cleavage/methylation domain-containing protein [Opitutaceae bacterium]|jgi:type II secretory pathway pseudopilin PulG|nr:prepilin-type N-terminal cleavage/methylation domain-containing protein [Opitutaceae bacterium]